MLFKPTYTRETQKLWARPQHCVAASHRKNLRRSTTHRGNFRCHMTSYNLLCDVVFAIRRRNAVLWFRPICRLDASFFYANEDRDVYDVWLSHWFKISNGPIEAPNVINVSIVVSVKQTRTVPTVLYQSLYPLQ